MDESEPKDQKPLQQKHLLDIVDIKLTSKFSPRAVALTSWLHCYHTDEHVMLIVLGVFFYLNKHSVREMFLEVPIFGSIPLE